MCPTIYPFISSCGNKGGLGAEYNRITVVHRKCMALHGMV